MDKSQDRRLFEDKLDTSFRDRLRRFFVGRRQTEADCDDLVQETLLKVLQQDEVHHVEHPGAYIFTVATNLLRDRARRQATRREVLTGDNSPANDAFFDIADEEPGAERILLDRDQLNQVMQALIEMPERTQIIFTLCRIEAVPHREVAERLGISVSAVEKHVSKALLRIAKRIER